MQLSRKLIEVSARRIVPSTARPERRRPSAYPSCQNIPPPIPLKLTSPLTEYTFFPPAANQPPQAGCDIIYLDEYIRRRDALMSKLTDLVSRHRRVGDLRFVAAGGDGTASWVAELIVDACAAVGTRNVPPIAVLCLGTGNELARVTGWGAGVHGTLRAKGGLRSFVRDVARGKVVGVDSWLWRAVPLRLDELGVPIEDVERVASELSRSKLGWHRSSGEGGARGLDGEHERSRLNGLEGRRGVGFGSAMFLNSVLEPLDSAGGGSGGSTGTPRRKTRTCREGPRTAPCFRRGTTGAYRRCTRVWRANAAALNRKFGIRFPTIPSPGTPSRPRRGRPRRGARPGPR